MLENSNLIDGSDRKKLDTLCKEYNDLVLKIKDLTKSKDSANTEIKSICNKGGTYETLDFIVNITEIEDTQKLDTKIVEEYLKDKHADIWEEICGVAMKVSKGYLKISSVKAKTGNRV